MSVNPAARRPFLRVGVLGVPLVTLWASLPQAGREVPAYQL